MIQQIILILILIVFIGLILVINYYRQQLKSLRDSIEEITDYYEAETPNKLRQNAVMQLQNELSVSSALKLRAVDKGKWQVTLKVVR